MTSALSLFAVLVEAIAPNASEKYRAGQRYELIVLVQETSMDKALGIARGALGKAMWAEPEFNEITRIAGKMSTAKLRRLNLEKGVAAAVKHGQAVIVFPETA